MKTLNKLAIVLLIIISGCHKSDTMDYGGPIVRYLGGKWRLDKIVTPTRTKTGSQIGYTEVIETGNDQVNDFDHVYRDSVLVATYIVSRVPPPEASASNMTVLVTYTNDKKRFFKIRQALYSITLETSGYLDQIGSAQDSVKYYYSQVQ